MICFHCCTRQNTFNDDDDIQLINWKNYPKLDTQLDSDDIILIKDHPKTRNFSQHNHRCTLQDIPQSKLQINFDQTIDCCPKNGFGHPDEYDCALKQYYQENVSCGYILLKVKIRKIKNT